MIVTDPDAFLAAFRVERFPPRAPATARAAFLVAPAGGAIAVESAADNRYMNVSRAPDPARLAAEHAELARRLADDIPLVTFPGDPDAPDGIFPNNVFATVPGRLIVGRMRHAVRRREAGRADIRAFFRDALGYRIVDLSNAPPVAELTGALVVDRARGIGFCGLSERCDVAGAQAMHDAFGLRLMFRFELAPGEYHTNVVLALLASRGVMIAPDGFRDARVPRAIAQAYRDCTIELDPGQRAAFAGNAITLGDRRVWLSERAARTLAAAQREGLDRAGFAIATVAIDEIERAGGSVRCCVAEIF